MFVKHPPNKGDNIQATQISDNVIERLVGEDGHKTGIAQRRGLAKLFPHDLRRAFARKSCNIGATLIQVQNCRTMIRPLTFSGIEEWARQLATTIQRPQPPGRRWQVTLVR